MSDAARKLLALIAIRDHQDTMSRAIGWAVEVGHVDTDERTIYGTFTEPAAALAWAHDFENGLNQEGEEGFRCTVRAIMPAVT